MREANVICKDPSHQDTNYCYHEPASFVPDDGDIDSNPLTDEKAVIAWSSIAGMFPAAQQTTRPLKLFTILFDSAATPGETTVNVIIAPFTNLDSDGDSGTENASVVVELKGDETTDTDGDGTADSSDAFPSDASETADTDGDGTGDNADVFPSDAAETIDTDGDGTGNNADTDDDGDGVVDSVDAFSLDATESLDTDSDGIGNNADSDDDGGGYSDDQELADGTDPLNKFSCAVGCFSFDVDQSSSMGALTDGLLVLRHLFSFSGDALVSNAVDSAATRTTAGEITSYLTDAQSEMDIDGDGQVGALTDGLLLLRHLFGFSGESLITGAVGTDATRTTAAEIQVYIEERLP